MDKLISQRSEPFLARVMILKNLKEDYPGNIPVKYCRNWPSSFREEDFLIFSYEKTDKPLGGAILGLGV